MSAAKHPYDIRNECGEFVSVAPEIRAALERMRLQPQVVDAICRPPVRRSLLRRIREWFVR